MNSKNKKSKKSKEKNLKDDNGFIYKDFPSEELTPEIFELMENTLSESYPIYTYRYYLNTWSDLCLMCYDRNEKNEEIFIGGIIGGIEKTESGKEKGYIAMISIKPDYRGKKIAQNLVNFFIERLKLNYTVEEIFLETESDNIAALKLYESLGFIKVRLNSNYYLNGKSAFKLKYFLN